MRCALCCMSDINMFIRSPTEQTHGVSNILNKIKKNSAGFFSRCTFSGPTFLQDIHFTDDSIPNIYLELFPQLLNFCVLLKLRKMYTINSREKIQRKISFCRNLWRFYKPYFHSRTYQIQSMKAALYYGATSLRTQT